MTIPRFYSTLLKFYLNHSRYDSEDLTWLRILLSSNHLKLPDYRYIYFFNEFLTFLFSKYDFLHPRLFAIC